mgnify:CR=1 FL=1
MTGGRIAHLLEEMADDIRAARLGRLEEIAPELEAAGIPLYAQHVDAMDNATLVDIFRADITPKSRIRMPRTPMVSSPAVWAMPRMMSVR